jgi:hypothetical protein
MLFWPRLRGWIIGVTLLFHAGIAVLMGIVFLNTPQLLVFVDWDRLTRSVSDYMNTLRVGWLHRRNPSNFAGVAREARLRGVRSGITRTNS